MNEAFRDYASLCFRGDGGDPEVNSERLTELFITRHGETEMPVLPEMTEKWAMKDREMDIDDMLAFWRGDIEHQYGAQAVHATLVAYLMLSEAQSQDEAKLLARSMWEQRDKAALPFQF